MKLTRVFENAGDFAALSAAESWLNSQGISHGSIQRGAPTGLLCGNFEIAKWRNLSQQERDELDGTMTGDFRNGPVIIELKGAA